MEGASTNRQQNKHTVDLRNRLEDEASRCRPYALVLNDAHADRSACYDIGSASRCYRCSGVDEDDCCKVLNGEKPSDAVSW